MSHRSEDIRERTMAFASAIARFRMTLPSARRDVEALGDQLLRAVSSVAAHVRQATRSRSDAEICSRLEGAILQADESMLCLEMLQNDCAINERSLAHLRQEADEIIGIFAATVRQIRGHSL
jgi:four helix bundle protein